MQDDSNEYEGDDKDSRDNEDDRHNISKVMRGWLTIYTSDDPKSPFTKLSARSQLLNKIKQLISHYKDEQLSIIFTGRSLGTTLSFLSAFDIVEKVTSELPVTAIIFGCPKVGNKPFKNKVDSLSNLKILHIRNVNDTIPHYPARNGVCSHWGSARDR